MGRRLVAKAAARELKERGGIPEHHQLEIMTRRLGELGMLLHPLSKDEVPSRSALESHLDKMVMDVLTMQVLLELRYD